MRIFLLVAICGLLIVKLSAVYALPLVTFGNSANPNDGDDDFSQVIFFKIPKSIKKPLYVRIFDPDCGGKWDESGAWNQPDKSEKTVGNWDTRTRFSLYGNSDNVIISKVFETNSVTDNHWYTLAKIIPKNGKQVGDYYLFKLLVQGEKGNDGNVFDVIISSSDYLNDKPVGVQLFNYAPTVSIPKKRGYFAEFRFLIPKTTKALSIHNFDLDGASFWFETAYGSRFPLRASKQGNWVKDKLSIKSVQTPKIVALIVKSLRRSSNTVVISVKNQNKVAIPIELPVRLAHYNQLPIPLAKTEFLSDCCSVVFDGSLSQDKDGHILKYFWDFGDGESAEGIRVTHKYQKSGTYNYQLTVQDDSRNVANKRSKTFKIVINKAPIAKAGDDQLSTTRKIYFDGNKSYDPDGSIIAWNWDFGDGQHGIGMKTNHIYRNSGTYLVTLTVTDDSGIFSKSNSDKLKVIINAKPIADAGPDRLVVPKEIIPFNAKNSFDSDGKIVSWHWDFGNGDSSDKENPFYAFKQPGVYRVKLRVGDDTSHSEAIGFDETIVTVNAPPIARAGVDIHTIPNELVELDAINSYDPDGKIKSYQWIFSDGEAAANTRKIKRSFARSGIYTAQLQITDNSGASNSIAEDSLIIHVNHQPVARIGKETAKPSCLHTFLFDASNSSDADGDSLHYRWNFGDGTFMQSGVKVNHTYIQAGKYPVILEVDDGTGLANATDTTSQKVIINNPPIANAGENRQACAGEVILFDASKSYDPDGGKLKYSWNLGETSLYGLNPIYTFKKVSIYPIKLTVEDDSGLQCNTDSTKFLIKIADAPIANAGEDQTVCTHTPVYFDGSGSSDSDGVVNSYDWNFGDNSRTGGATPIHLYKSPGIYTVNLTITGDKYGHCPNVHNDDLIVTVIPTVTATLSAPHEIAVGTTAKFSATQLGTRPISQWLWDFGDGKYDEGKVVKHKYTKSGSYILKLIVKDKSKTPCNQSVIQQPIIVNASPIAIAGNNQQILLHEVAIFDASASNDPDGVLSDYQWDFGDGQTAKGYLVRHQYNKVGYYTVKLRVKDNLDLSNSYSEDTLQIQVYAPTWKTSIPAVQSP
jgi:PKD repeat protein